MFGGGVQSPSHTAVVSGMSVERENATAVMSSFQILDFSSMITSSVNQ